MDEKQFRFLFPALSVFLLILGILLIIWPAQLMNLSCYILGAGAIAFGCVKIVAYFLQREFAGFYRYTFVTGMLSLLGGIFLLINPEPVRKILIYLLGVILIVTSLIKMQNAFDLYRNRYNAWWSVLLASFIGAGLGVAIFFKPFAVEGTLIRFIGISFILDALLNIWTYICIVRKLRQMSPIEAEGKIKDDADTDNAYAQNDTAFTSSPDAAAADYTDNTAYTDNLDNNEPLV